MSTPAQITANQANAQFSTGPKTETGKATSSLNHLRHGLAGQFKVLPFEEQSQFDQLRADLIGEHQPVTPTERLLVEKMAQHLWLSQRALTFQDVTLSSRAPLPERKSELALFLRYQTTHDRAFHKALNDLLKLRTEKRKAEIGFESQERKRAEETRRQANENRKRELHKWKALFAQAEVDHRVLLNGNLAGPGGQLSVTIPRIIAAENAA